MEKLMVLGIGLLMAILIAASAIKIQNHCMDLLQKSFPIERMIE